ncbi:MAG: cyclic nucleotide-gated ion channel/potassium channel family protein [Beijerinckiaceae bacterium]|nr:cyclic nucleotide-gated ion channel/potassium channel family protein [Beijerinckiaceae bacterium]
MNGGIGSSKSGLRRAVHLALDSGIGGSRWSVLTHRLIVTLIIISILAMIVESMPPYAAAWRMALLAIEITVIAGFTIEYILRFWSAPEATYFAGLHPWRARLKYVLSPIAILDFLSIAPLYLMLFADIDLRALLMFRLLRFFKLARYSPGMRSLMSALETERKALLATGVVLAGVVLISASAMHVVEAAAQPGKFGTIPDAMWWSIVTVTTVGYGDVVPVTTGGRIIAALTTICGLIMLALPVGIIATAFAEDIHKREFVVTWGMLARVPIFSSLSASEIADFMPYLRSQTVQSGIVIMRRGDHDDCIYFIISGTVERAMRKSG